MSVAISREPRIQINSATLDQVVMARTLGREVVERLKAAELTGFFTMLGFDKSDGSVVRVTTTHGVDPAQLSALLRTVADMIDSKIGDPIPFMPELH